MSERFFCPQPISGDRAMLDGSEAHHLLHVMRMSIGDRVTVFDGTGAEFEAEVVTTGRREVELAVLKRRDVDRELAFQLTVGAALPKGDRQKWLVEKLTELGVARLVPLVTARGVAQPTGTALARLRRSVVEACKQCGRNRLLVIEPALDWPTFIGSQQQGDRWVAHPGGNTFGELLREKPGDVALAIGPEGGFTDDEIQLAQNDGWQCVQLGARILRVETAAVALTAAIVLGKST